MEAMTDLQFAVICERLERDQPLTIEQSSQLLTEVKRLQSELLRLYTEHIAQMKNVNAFLRKERDRLLGI